jgi:biotin operon repressor
LGVRFALEGGELVVARPDGARFVGYEELAAALEQERARAERLAQRLRELGIDPE